MNESFLDITGGENVPAFEEFPVKCYDSPNTARASSRRLSSVKLASSSKQSVESR